MYFTKAYLARGKIVRKKDWARERFRPLAQPVLLFSSSHGECHVRHHPAFPRVTDIRSYSKSGRKVTNALEIVNAGQLRIPSQVSHVIVLLGGNDISSRRGQPCLQPPDVKRLLTTWHFFTGNWRRPDGSRSVLSCLGPGTLLMSIWRTATSSCGKRPAKMDSGKVSCSDWYSPVLTTTMVFTSQRLKVMGWF